MIHTRLSVYPPCCILLFTLSYVIFLFLKPRPCKPDITIPFPLQTRFPIDPSRCILLFTLSYVIFLFLKLCPRKPCVTIHFSIQTRFPIDPSRRIFPCILPGIILLCLYLRPYPPGSTVPSLLHTGFPENPGRRIFFCNIPWCAFSQQQFTPSLQEIRRNPLPLKTLPKKQQLNLFVFYAQRQFVKKGRGLYLYFIQHSVNQSLTRLHTCHGQRPAKPHYLICCTVSEITVNKVH